MTCSRCGGAIGSYEPLVLLLDGKSRETSRAAEPDVAVRVGAKRFHVMCFDGVEGGSANGGD